MLGDFEAPAAAPALLRALRAGELHARIHPAQPIVTIGANDELATVRAYEAGSDHHVSSDSAYLVVRAVISAIVRRTLADVTSRHLHVGRCTSTRPRAASSFTAARSHSAARSSICSASSPATRPASSPRAS